MWLEGWKYRKRVTIENICPVPLTNETVDITTDTQTPISQGKMRSDGGDIRLTFRDGKYLLSYQIVSGLGTTSTVLRVKLPKIAGWDKELVYLYYGNPSATDQSTTLGAPFYLFEVSVGPEITCQEVPYKRVDIYHGGTLYQAIADVEELIVKRERGKAAEWAVVLDNSTGYYTDKVSEGDRVDLYLGYAEEYDLVASGLVYEKALGEDTITLSGFDWSDYLYGPMVSEEFKEIDYGSVLKSLVHSYTPLSTGTCLSLDGSNDYIRVPSSASYKPPSTLTLVAWVYPRSFPTNWSKIISLDYRADGSWSSPYFSYALERYSNTNYFGVGWTVSGTKYEYSSGLAFTMNSWNHVAVTFDGSTVRTYLNGVAGSTFSQGGTLDYGTSKDLAIGVRSPYSPGEYWDGLIREVRIYNRALSADEIRALYEGKDVKEGAVLILKLNEGEGRAAKDSSGYGNNGTLYGGATWVTKVPRTGTALSFDGIDDYVDMGNILPFPGTQPFSVSFWTIIPSILSYRIISKEVPSPWDGWAVHSGAGQVRLTRASNGSGEGTYLAVPLNKLCHVAFVWTGTQYRAYLNGVWIRTTTGSQSIPAVDVPLRIGCRSDLTSYFRGFLDEIYIFDRALTDQEVKDLYCGKEVTGAVAIWRFDEGGGTIAKDSSGSGYNGTVYGATWTAGHQLPSTWTPDQVVTTDWLTFKNTYLSEAISEVLDRANHLARVESNKEVRLFPRLDTPVGQYTEADLDEYEVGRDRSLMVNKVVVAGRALNIEDHFNYDGSPDPALWEVISGTWSCSNSILECYSPTTPGLLFSKASSSDQLITLGAFPSTDAFGSIGEGQFGVGDNEITGSRVTSPNIPLEAWRLRVRVNSTGSGHKMKGAIYKRTGQGTGTLVATTEEITFGAVNGYLDLNLSRPVELLPNTEYYLVVWLKLGSGSVYIYGKRETYRGFSTTVTYDSWPSELSGQETDETRYILCYFATPIVAYGRRKETSTWKDGYKLSVGLTKVTLSKPSGTLASVELEEPLSPEGLLKINFELEGGSIRAGLNDICLIALEDREFNSGRVALEGPIGVRARFDYLLIKTRNPVLGIAEDSSSVLVFGEKAIRLDRPDVPTEDLLEKIAQLELAKRSFQPSKGRVSLDGTLGFREGDIISLSLTPSGFSENMEIVAVEQVAREDWVTNLQLSQPMRQVEQTIRFLTSELKKAGVL